MPFLLVYAVNKKVVEQLRKHKSRNPQLHVAQFGGKLFLMINNGEALAYATKLMLEHKGWVETFIVEPLTLDNVPEKVRRVAEWKLLKPLAKYPKREETLEKQGLPSVEELRNVRLNLSLGSNAKSSESLNVQDLMKRLRHARPKTKKN